MSQKRQKPNLRKKLSTENKLAIMQSETSSRTLAEEYNVHHSVVNDIRNEAHSLLNNHWDEKSQRVGRPAKPIEATETIELKKVELERYKNQVRQSWLELQLELMTGERDYAVSLLKKQDSGKSRKKKTKVKKRK